MFVYAMPSVAKARALVLVMSRLPYVRGGKTAFRLVERVSHVTVNGKPKTERRCEIVFRPESIPDETLKQLFRSRDDHATEITMKLRAFCDGYLLGLRHARNAKYEYVERVVTSKTERSAFDAE